MIVGFLALPKHPSSQNEIGFPFPFDLQENSSSIP